MSNPFKEAEKAKKKAPGSKHEHEHEVKEEETVPVEAPAEPEVPAEQPEAKTEAKPIEKPAKPEQPALDIFANLGKEKPSGKTYAFYLSDDNVNKLKKMAEKKKISASKLLDHILSEIL